MFVLDDEDFRRDLFLTRVAGRIGHGREC
jgi:hypothetical protein